MRKYLYNYSSPHNSYQFHQTFGKQNHDLPTTSPFQHKIINQNMLHRVGADIDVKSTPLPNSKNNTHLSNSKYRESGKSNLGYGGGSVGTFNMEYIDQINNKIQGLIRSISESCQHKSINNHLHREIIQTIQPPYISNECSVFIENKLKMFYNQKTQKKKTKTFAAFKQIQSNNFTERQAPQQNRLQISTKREINVYEFEDLNQQIQRISNKIQQYEIKVGIAQPQQSNQKQGNKLKAIEDFNNINYNHVNLNNISSKRKRDRPNIGDLKSKRANKQKQTGNQFKQNAKDKELAKSSNIKKNVVKKEVVSGVHKESSEIQVFKEKQQPKKAILADAPPRQNIPQSSSFIKTLLTQISLDRDLRYSKHIFAGICSLSEDHNLTNSDDTKWQVLHKEMVNEGFDYSLRKVKYIFMPREDQIDPFMSVSHCYEEMVHGLIFAYQQAQKHWSQHIAHSWTNCQLEQCQFTIQKIDRQHKGYITVQDLTTFINTQVDGAYRNRDLMLVFIRLGMEHYGSDTPQKGHHNYVQFTSVLDQLIYA